MENERFGRYALIRRLGYGGMAEVFLARVSSFGGFEKHLAIKRLLPYCTQDQSIVDLLADEAKITVRLTHPNIVQVFDFGKVEDSYFIAMEYIDGLDLKSLIRIDEQTSAPLPFDVALYVTISVLEALEFAHNQTDLDGTPLGIIHRDVSPHNVLISRHGQVKLSDFGVARAAISRHVSFVGDIRGKFSYMPPEQLFGVNIDRRVDIFAVGAILYELIVGRSPYRSANAADQIKQLSQGIPPPSVKKKGIHPKFDQTVLRALEKDPERRFQTASEFIGELKSLLASECKSDLMRPVKELSKRVNDRMDNAGMNVIEPEIEPMSMEVYLHDETSLVGNVLVSVKGEIESSEIPLEKMSTATGFKRPIAQSAEWLAQMETERIELSRLFEERSLAREVEFASPISLEDTATIVLDSVSGCSISDSEVDV
ncbi:MAG: serine/threonine-protein kinase, partial [Pseudomonadota bacterium]